MTINRRIDITRKWVEKFEQELDRLEAMDIQSMNETEVFFHKIYLDAVLSQMKTLAQELSELLADGLKEKGGD